MLKQYLEKGIRPHYPYQLSPDRIYGNLVAEVLEHGYDNVCRTKDGTKYLPNQMLRYDLRYGQIPLLHSRKLPLTNIVNELYWFMSGDSEKAWLNQNGIHYWNHWGDPVVKDEEGTYSGGSLGHIYGTQWRDFGGQGVDQLADLVHGLCNDPYSRRHVLTAWNPVHNSRGEVALPPCHMTAVFTVTPISEPATPMDWLALRKGIKATDDPITDLLMVNESKHFNEVLELTYELAKVKGRLSCHLHMRSNDLGIGHGFNIAQYGLLTHLIGAMTGLYPDELMITMDNAHVYKNQIQPLTQVLNRINLTGFSGVSERRAYIDLTLLREGLGDVKEIPRDPSEVKDLIDRHLLIKYEPYGLPIKFPPPAV